MNSEIPGAGARDGAASPIATSGEARSARAAEFLRQAGWADAALSPLAGDASRRRYLRLRRPNGATAVLMDAPPESGEDARPFAAVTGLLRERGFSAPEIYSAEFSDGWLLLEDLGDALFARRMAAQPQDEAWLYQTAVDLLRELHASPAPAAARGYGAELEIAPYDWSALIREASLFVEWYLPGVAPGAEAEELSVDFQSVVKAVCEETGADRFRDDAARLTLRDYHAENLLWLADRPGLKRVGLLDYQDALAGHPEYDLVSLLEDARRDVGPALTAAMIGRYCAACGIEGAERRRFDARYAALGAQRNLKILGIFARLWRRDGKAKYLSLLPRVWGYLQRDLSHPALEPLKRWTARRAPPPDPRALAALRGAPAPDGAPRAHAPDTAMVLAAGLGTRLRPLTETTPKPLIEIGGRPLIDHALARLEEAGVRRAVVNAHHLADQIHAFVGAWNFQERAPELQVSEERDLLLETGGGVRRALPRLNRDAFLVINSDNIWTGAAPLQALGDAWDPERMDALLLLCPIDAAAGYTRQGDFSLDPEGRLIRRGAQPQAPLVYTGAQILKARAFDGAPDGPFSLNLIWDALIAAGRAYGVHHTGGWADVGGFAGLEAAATLLQPAPPAAEEPAAEASG